MPEYDPGPPPRFEKLFARFPSYERFRNLYWYDWGPVFYRGRLDGSARVLAIASDPGPTERLYGRTLVGDAGQRVQGFFHKLGLTRSYLCLNAHLYALHPSDGRKGLAVLADEEMLKWRNELYSAAKRPRLQAILAFGAQAQEAVQLWDGKGNLPVFDLPHPSSRNPETLASRWGQAVNELRAIVTPDADGDVVIANYGATLVEADHARIPRFDLPFGLPDFAGDDSFGRAQSPPRRNAVARPVPDDEHTLVWRAPKRE
jgi:uracil-DNA glycosylase